MALPWPQARDFAQAVGRQQRDRLVAAAVAARAARCDDKDWQRWLETMGEQ